ncbi:sensor histidine kinase [Aliikangiella sp. IMCC44359]|uniref:sensor histidine kinase n=1 Tax=Aliikangiella sp. IMCC44359 TaxID=3459125 RepID=UPI00403B2958
MIISDFERNFTLKELIPKQSQLKIKKSLLNIGVESFLIEDNNGEMLTGAGRLNDYCEIELVPELEVVGILKVPHPKKELASAVAELIVDIMQTNWRYQMSSDLHIQTIQEDYDALLKKSQALEVSEKKYKQLSETLEARVKTQVNMIEVSQRQLYETEKMASIGQLAAGVAHEVNNPIGFIKSNLNTAAEYLTELYGYFQLIYELLTLANKLHELDKESIDEILDDFLELINESYEGAARVSAIVADLKKFSDIEKSEEEIADLKVNIEAVVNSFLLSEKNKDKIKMQLSPVEKTICYPNHINQMLINLLNNAVDATAEAGSINLTCGMESNEILIVVSDTGKGMGEDVLKKIFDPFFTTHDVGGGTGLGLTVCRDVVNAHSGKIQINSQPNVGTQVEIRLPVKN